MKTKQIDDHVRNHGIDVEVRIVCNVCGYDTMTAVLRADAGELIDVEVYGGTLVIDDGIHATCETCAQLETMPDA